MANAGSRGAESLPPADLAALPPRERFDRLFDRMMRAGAEGDSTTVVDAVSPSPLPPTPRSTRWTPTRGFTQG